MIKGVQEHVRDIAVDIVRSGGAEVQTGDPKVNKQPASVQGDDSGGGTIQSSEQPASGQDSEQPENDQENVQEETGQEDQKPETDQEEEQPADDQKDEQQTAGQGEEQPADDQEEEQPADDQEETQEQQGRGSFKIADGGETEETTGIIQQFFSNPVRPLAVSGGILCIVLAAVLLKLRANKIRKKKRKRKEEREDGDNLKQTAEPVEIPVSVMNEPQPEMPESIAPSPDVRPSGVYMSKVHQTGKRRNQQDSFGVSQNGEAFSTAGKGLLAIVADGMGGLSNGAEVSARVTMSMMESFEQLPETVSGEKRLLQMLNTTNRDVNRMLRGKESSGSTLVSALIQGDELYWLTVGDSHLYLYRDGALMQMNRDHVYGTELDEKAARGEISMEAAAGDPQRKALTSYIGMGEIEKIDRNIRGLKLLNKDRVLLMTDGVFGTLSDEEIAAAMRLPVEESSVAIEQMIQGKNRPAQDNYTALILEYIW